MDHNPTNRVDCPCRMCRKARMLERRSWEPLTRRDKIYISGSFCACGGILVLFALAAIAS